MNNRVCNFIKVKDYVDFIGQFYAGGYVYGIIHCDVYLKASFSVSDIVLALESIPMGTVSRLFDEYYLFNILSDGDKPNWQICKEMPIGEQWNVVRWSKKDF